MKEIFENESVAVEVGRFETATGTRLVVRDPGKGAEIHLDAIELEGLARAASEPPEQWPEGLEVLKNEFAMVEVGKVETTEGSRLLIRDSASGAEARLNPSELRRLASVRHGYFGPLLDPSELDAEGEPDPDQV